MSSRTISIASVLLVGAVASSAQLSAAVLFNPVVSQVGDGNTIGSGVGVTTSLAIYQNSVANQASPVTSMNYSGLVNTNSTVEGQISNSPSLADAAAKGQAFSGTGFIFNAGYAGSDGATAVTTTANRVVGFMTVGAGTLSSPTIGASQPQAAAYNGSTFRGAAGDDTATNLWTAGTASTAATAGFRYFNTNTIIPGTPTNTRTIEVRNGNVFGGTSSGSAVGVYALGADAPLTSQTGTSLIATGTSADHAPESFVLLTDPANTNSTANTFGYNVAYIADDGTAASEAAGTKGIEKWVLGTSGWTNVYTIADSAGSGYRGVAATLDAATGNMVIWATTADGTELEQFTDPLSGVTDASAADASALVLATAPTNDLFRGVALAPAAGVAAAPEPASIGLLVVGGMALISRRRANVRA